MTTLAQWRQTVANTIATVAGIPNAYPSVPRAPVRPCVVVQHQPDQYLVTTGVGGMFSANYQVLLIAAAELPNDAADELDGYLDALAQGLWGQPDPAVNLRATTVTGLASWALAGGQYPGLALDVNLALCVDPVTPPPLQTDAGSQVAG